MSVGGVGAVVGSHRAYVGSPRPSSFNGVSDAVVRGFSFSAYCIRCEATTDQVSYDGEDPEGFPVVVEVCNARGWLTPHQTVTRQASSV